MDRPLSEERVNELIGYHLTPQEEQALYQALRRYHPDENRITPSFLDLLRLNIENGATKDNHTIDDIDHILLVGGPMKMPCVRKAIREVFTTNQKVMEELQAIEAKGFPVDPMQCVAKGAALWERDVITGIATSYRYAVEQIELPQQNGITRVYCYPENYIPAGIIPPATKSANDTAIIQGTEVQVEPITVLVGEEGIFGGVKTIHWKKSRTFAFRPVFIGGESSYTIELDMNDDQSVIASVHDNNIEARPYDFLVTREEELPADRYDVKIERYIPPLTYGLIPQLVLLGMFTCIKAEAWLKETHEPEEEQNRPAIEEHLGVLKSLLDKLESLAEGVDPNTPITDQKLLASMEIVRNAIRELIKLTNLTTISGHMIDEARIRARSLAVQVGGLGDGENGNASLFQKVQQKNEELEKLNPPHLKKDEWTKKLDVIKAYIVYTDRIDELKMALDAYKDSCRDG
jgi:hypothetical protein